MYTTYIYDGSFNGLISAVYDAFYARLPVSEVRIIEDCSSSNVESGNSEIINSPTLFDNEIVVETSAEKAKKVLSAIIEKTSYDAYNKIYLVYLSYYPQKGDLIYKYIKLCFSMGSKVFIHISNPVIFDIDRLARRVSGEKHKLLGFVRFQQLEGGSYFSRITPENNQLELIAPHFSERMYDDNWIIYDANRKLACVHRAGQQDFIITDDIPIDILEEKMDSYNTEEESAYRLLWKAFFDTIGIKERFNPRCQRNLMPKRYWENMVEVKDTLK